MSFNDPIAQLLTHIRNAKDAKHRFLDIGLSMAKIGIVKILKDKGFINEFIIDEKKKKLRIYLKYTKARESVIHNLKRVSKPGMRKYVSYQDIPRVFNGFGISILSTSKGVLDDVSARRMKIGGELLCFVW